MAMETRVWRTGFESNLLTTVPKAVRDQLALVPTDRLRWSVEGGYARVTKAAVEDPEAATYRVYKQTRGNSLYTTLPAAVVDQLRMSDRSRVEWELQGVAAHVRKA